MSKTRDEMRREYDFSAGIRGKFYRRPETQRLIPVDADIVAFFQARARGEQRAYHALINEALRQVMASSVSHDLLALLRGLVAEQVDHELAQRGIVGSKQTQTRGKKSPIGLESKRSIAPDEDS